MIWPISRIALRMQKYYISKRHKQHRDRNSEAYVEIDSILESFISSGGLQHDFQRYKLFQLKKLLEQQQPNSILELGSGSSTAIFANYIREYGGTLHSVDESERWLKNSANLAGVDANDSRFQMRYCSAKVSRFDSRPCVGYGLALPPHANQIHNYDLIFVDGPSLRLNGEKIKGAINDDVFHLAEISLPRNIVVDGRFETVRVLEKYFKNSYQITRSDLMDKSFPDIDYEYFSIFVRK